MFYLGIDVAKAKIDCCLILVNSTSKKKTKTFSNTQNGFEQLQIWLNHHAATSMQTITSMEATSIYHELLAQYLFRSGYQVCVTNLARARYFAQSMSKLNKTYKVDSEILARFAMTADLHFWQPLPEHIQLLNALLERRAVLYDDLQRKMYLVLQDILDGVFLFRHKQRHLHVYAQAQQFDDHLTQFHH